MNSNFIYFIYSSTNEEIFNFMIEKEIIRKKMICAYCNTFLILKKSKDSRIEYLWRCLNYSFGKYQTTVSVLKDSIFSQVKIELSKLLLILYILSKDSLINKIFTFTSINKNVL
ncbi:hypothetical protein DMUE_3787 [Dictyocoela muelleri]|nr:hypothetical protein DMUE_3787 [Dictyocoela muelleri]